MDCINPVNGVAMQMTVNRTVPNTIEHQVDDGGALGVAAGADGSQNGGDTGADVLSKRRIRCPVPITPQASALQDTHRGGGGLDQAVKAAPARMPTGWRRCSPD